MTLKRMDNVLIVVDAIPADSANGRLSYRLKTSWDEGTTHVVMNASELIEQLAALVPPTCAARTRTWGTKIYASCAVGPSKLCHGTRQIGGAYGLCEVKIIASC
jgi:putative transposase